jgi:hypothetical protein
MMNASAPNPANSSKPSSSEDSMESPALTNAKSLVDFWETVEHWAFLGVVVTLAIEFAAAHFVKSPRRILDDARQAELETARRDTANAQVQLLQLRFPRSLDIKKFEAAVKEMSPPIEYEVLYDANAPDAEFLASLIWGIFFNAKWPTQQKAGAAPLKAPPPNSTYWANKPWTVAAGGGPWGLSIVTNEPVDFDKPSLKQALARALGESVKGPPSMVTLGSQTPEPLSPGSVRIIVGPKVP